MQLGRVEVTSGFLLLMAWMNYLDTQLIVPLALSACALHELGHYLVLRCMGNNIRLLRLSCTGAEMIPTHSMSYVQELLAAAAGPLTSFLLAFLFCRWGAGQLFAGLNLVLGCLNILPISPLDGGRVLKCTLSLLSGPYISAQICVYLDLVLTVTLLLFSLLLAFSSGNLTLLTVSLWLTLPYFNGKERKRGLPDWVRTGKIR